jgi:hypothetical protein
MGVPLRRLPGVRNLGRRQLCDHSELREGSDGSRRRRVRVPADRGGCQRCASRDTANGDARFGAMTQGSAAAACRLNAGRAPPRAQRAQRAPERWTRRTHEINRLRGRDGPRASLASGQEESWFHPLGVGANCARRRVVLGEVRRALWCDTASRKTGTLSCGAEPLGELRNDGSVARLAASGETKPDGWWCGSAALHVL